MTFAQILVLCIVVCLTLVQIVNMITTASVRKAPGSEDVLETVAAALVRAKDDEATVLVTFNGKGMTVFYDPKGDGSAVQDGDKH